MGSLTSVIINGSDNHQIVCGKSITIQLMVPLPHFAAGLQPCTSCCSTKAIAERMVLDANGDSLVTCAVRPAAIYGEGETRHFPRIINIVNQGACRSDN